MWLTDELLLYYQRCQRRSFLDVYGNQSWRSSAGDFLLKLQQDSRDRRSSVLAGQIYHQPNYPKRDWFAGARATLELMQLGANRIYRGVLLAPADNFSLPVNFGLGLKSENSRFSETGEQIFSPKYNPPFSPIIDTESRNSTFDRLMLVSNPDLLVKQPGDSIFGNWIYIPAEIKLGRRSKPEYKIIAAFHALVLATVQGVWPETARLMLRFRLSCDVDLEKWVPQMQAILEECIETLLSPQPPEVFISRQRCNFCQWYGHCYAIAKSSRHLSLLPGVTPSRYQHLQSLKLTTLESLAATDPSRLEPALSESAAIGLVRQARSTLQNQPILNPDQTQNGVPPLQLTSENYLPTASVELYFDIEAQPDLNFDYLLGVLVVDRLAQTQTFYPFLAEQPTSEESVWRQFLDLVWSYPDAPIFHFSPYEAAAVKRLSKLYKTPTRRAKYLLSRFVDVHNRAVGAVTLPVESYSLKAIATWLGFEWRDSGASGSQSIYWYDRWLSTRDRSFLEAIVRYNEDDCRATLHVKNWLVNFVKKSLTNS